MLHAMLRASACGPCPCVAPHRLAGEAELLAHLLRSLAQPPQIQLLQRHLQQQRQRQQAARRRQHGIELSMSAHDDSSSQWLQCSCASPQAGWWASGCVAMCSGCWRAAMYTVVHSALYSTEGLNRSGIASCNKPSRAPHAAMTCPAASRLLPLLRTSLPPRMPMPCAASFMARMRSLLRAAGCAAATGSTTCGRASGQQPLLDVVERPDGMANPRSMRCADACLYGCLQACHKPDVLTINQHGTV